MRDDSLIIDVGMHVGQDSAFYLAQGFRVVAIEANPALAREAEARFRSEIAAGRLTVLNTGVGDSEGVLPFYVNAQHSEWSSFDQQIGSRGGCREVIDVPMLPFERVLERYGVPHYLKIDIEGHDFIVLQRLLLVADRPLYISVENGWPPMLDCLTRLGYTAFKFVNQAEVPKREYTLRGREGAELTWTFPFGASGPFGEDAPGAWKNAESILGDIQSYWNNPNFDPNVYGWYDLHAKLA